MFTKIAQLTKLIPFLALPLFAVACDPAQPQDGDELTGAEDVASAVSALCTDSGAANVSGQLILGDVGGTVTGTSPTQTYGTAACSGRYVVEATQTNGKPNISASVTWADAGLSQSICASGTVSMLVYGFSPISNSWVQLGSEVIAHGSMVPAPFGGAPSCQVGTGVNVSSSYTKVRVAAKAYLSTVFGPAPKKVTATIFSHH